MTDPSQTDEIVPKIIEEIPAKTISITYENNKEVNLGQELTPTDVQNDPISVKWETNPGKLYTLLMIDLDAPSRKWAFLSEITHWQVSNISGCDLATGEVSCEYAGAGPPSWGGMHRYVFLLFEHDGKIDFGSKVIGKNDLKARLRFSVKQFRKKYGFEKVYAWNYFNAQWDLSVDEKRKERSLCVLI